MRPRKEAKPGAPDQPKLGRRGGRTRSGLGYTRPETYEELRAVLASGTVHFPKRLRQVAIFLWQHPRDVALGTIVQVAEQAGVQPSTLVRFAQIFGYGGFSDFQTLFKEHIKGSRPESRVRGEMPETAASDGDGSLHFLNGFIAASHASLDRIGERFDHGSFEAIVGMLADAALIYVIGSKRAFPVAAYLSLTLSQQGIRNLLVDNVGSTAFDQVGCAGPGDAVLAISFSPYNSITPDLVAIARERGARIAALTDSTFSPLIGAADLWLEVIESDFAGFRSLAGSLAVGMALAHAVAARQSAAHRPQAD